MAGCNSEKIDTGGGCISCHAMTLDKPHQLACTVCHKGNDQGESKEAAHADMLFQPAHPDNLAATCGPCHQDETAELSHSLHYTLRNSVNAVRQAFGATDTLASLTDIPIKARPDTITELADDLLRRRCLRCHLFSQGDDYSATSHATGCGACHLAYSDGKLVDHTFKAPEDGQCLSCHYGNRVGFDFYGRFEHDFNKEYRTPYTIAETTDRPYGVEYHNLAPDIHQQRGLVCIDCHGREELMASEKTARKVSCGGCHDQKLLAERLPPGVQKDTDGYLFISKNSGNRHRLPLLRHAAHFAYPSVSCQACHAQWSFNDSATHLLRSDLDEYDPWALLTVQGSSEVEFLLEHNLDFEKTELPPSMTDKITGEIREGVWYKGYTMRRWESLPLGRSEDGLVSVMRPVLNLTLSWIDEEENVVYDGKAAASDNHGLLPYVPHTTGPAGLFYEQRLQDFYRQEHSTGP